MTEVAAAVTDTHPLLHHAAGGKRLGKRARELFRACDDREALVYVPAAVAWEVSLLARVGRVHLEGSPRDFFEALFGNPAYQRWDLTLEQVYLADELELGTDPFDRLICASALNLGLPLVTADQEIRDSGLFEILWD
jgi:PIN domain nuclease of toxin-antitoxin system